MPARKKTVDELAAEVFSTPEGKTAVYKLVAKDTKPLSHSKLAYAFPDLDGKKHYRFPMGVAMPGQRFGQLNEFLMYMSNAMTAEQDKDFDEQLATVLMSDQPEVQKKIRYGAIIQEKANRRNMCIHTELMYNFMAVQLVREDENPEVYDADIQKQKVRMFKEMTANQSTYFFFQATELNRLSDLSRLSQSEWDEYWQNSLIKNQAHKEILNTLTNSPILSTSSGTIPKSS